jgi:hypothetical protein
MGASRLSVYYLTTKLVPDKIIQNVKQSEYLKLCIAYHIVLPLLFAAMCIRGLHMF